MVEIYKLTKFFPKEEQFGLTSQMRRSSISIPSNIAEGAGRKGSKEFNRFLYIALGSLAEIETQLEIAYRLNHNLHKTNAYKANKEFEFVNLYISNRVTQC